LKHPGAKPAQEVCAAAGSASAAARIIAAIGRKTLDLVFFMCAP
jgi:hypothetical protein